MGADSEQTGRIGVHCVATLVLRNLGWIFREQHESDYGIDAIIETAAGGRPTGRLVAMQIRSGPSYFTEDSPMGGWVMRGPKRHLTYWLEYQLPVLVVLVNTHTGDAHWAHVNLDTASFTPKGYRIDVPCTHVLDGSAKYQIESIVERWVPLRGDGRSRARNAIARCLTEGIPVFPSNSLWDVFAANSIESQLDGYQSTTSALTYNLSIAGEAPVAVATTIGGVRPLTLRDLRGSWWVPPRAEVYVCENPLVIHAAIARLGTACKPLVCLGGAPNSATAYLLLGLGFCGARVKVHTDHDHGGRVISGTLFNKTIDYEEWCPNAATDQRHLTEEQCLPYMLEDLRV